MLALDRRRLYNIVVIRSGNNAPCTNLHEGMQHSGSEDWVESQICRSLVRSWCEDILFYKLASCAN